MDSLNPEYLENALADVVGDIMGALWALLRPSQPLRSHAMAAMQLLGKLGECLSVLLLFVYGSHSLT